MRSVSVEVACYAKLNLYLRVYGKRDDGFHDIISVMQSIELCDRLLLEDVGGEGIVITSDMPGVPTDSSNLVWKAAELLAGRSGRRTAGLRVTIEKNIPVMGGLAGGSADAAGALWGLNKLWNLGLESRELVELASKLGSDVPFCVTGGTAVVRGRGERVEPFPVGVADRLPEPGAFLLVLPDVQVETKQAYDLLDNSRENERLTQPDLGMEYETVREVWQESLLSGSFPALFHNDFEEPVFSNNPLLKKLHDHLRDLAGHAVLSGSGSAMFAYFSLLRDAQAACENYTALFGETALVARPVGFGSIVQE